MSAQAKPEPIWLHGPPDGLEGLAPAGPDLPGEARLELAKLDLVIEVQCAEAGAGLCWIYASLPPRTPGGTHTGRLVLDDRVFEAMVVIHPTYQVTLTPTQLVAQIKPGDQTKQHFVVINHGNAPLVLARDNAFGLMREDGIEDALSSAYRAAAQGLDRVAVAADALAERHALVAARIEGGPITVEPDQHARFVVTLRWPRKLAPGSYEGTWTLATQNLTVSVTALEGEPGTDTGDNPLMKRIRS